MILFFALLTSLSSFAADIASLEEQLQKDPNRISIRLALASAYGEKGDNDKVISLLNPYTDQLTNRGFQLLAISYSNKKDHHNEVRVLKLLATKDESNYENYMLLGQAYLKEAYTVTDQEMNKELTTSAIKNFRQTLQLKPKYKPAFDTLLRTLLNQSARNEARELLMEGINNFGKRPELYQELCRVDALDGYLPQAATNCQQAIELASNYPDSYVYMIQTLSDQGEDKKAETLTVRAARKFPKSEFVQWSAGTVFLRKKNFPVAARYFQTAVAADDSSGRAHFGLAQALFDSGEPDKALEHFVKACRYDGNTVETFLSSAGRLKQSGKMDLGLQYTKSAESCRLIK